MKNGDLRIGLVMFEDYMEHRYKNVRIQGQEIFLNINPQLLQINKSRCSSNLHLGLVALNKIQKFM